MKTVSLNGVWDLTGKAVLPADSEVISIKGNVPGCAQLDLAENGYLPKDLFMGENIRETEKFEDYDWWYERTFEVEDIAKNVFLVFEGVDCLAEYYLNDVKIGESDNMLIPVEFKVDDYIKVGQNTLKVHIRSEIEETYNKEFTLKYLSTARHEYGRHTRRALHTYGWDIMPRALTAGLWRDVKLEYRDDLYFSQVYVIMRNKDVHRLYYEISGDRCDFKDVEIEIEGSCGEDSRMYRREKCPMRAGFFQFLIENPKLWFPYGYGEANVYDYTLRIYSEGRLVHSEEFTYGIRDVKLERTDTTDGINGKFRFLVNGVEIMCKGSNWVPLDAFHCRDAERYDEALALVKDVGCNILRCWGGNVYEDTKFYDFCDRNGVMIWQDFSMACSLPPENKEYAEMMEKEAVSVIKKLRRHPSIILWSGDNEIDAAMVNAGINPSSNSITREVLKRCVETHDFYRPYLASSPYISEEAFNKGVKSQVTGTSMSEEHLWGPRDYYKSDFYKTSRAHFVSETGYHGCPSMKSIKKFITPDKVWPYQDNSEWILHSSDQKGNPDRVMLMEKQVRQLFGTVPTDPVEYILASQISQAEAKKYFIERIRVGRPYKTGIIWWNLLDGWPQMSDAVVDYYFEKKLAYDYIKYSQAPFAICAGEINNWALPIYACNDTLEKKKGTVEVVDALTDEVLYSGEFDATENATTLITRVPVYYSEQRFLVFKWDIDGEKGFNHYLCGYPAISLEMYKEFLQKHFSSFMENYYSEV